MFSFLLKYLKSVLATLVILYLSFSPPSSFKQFPAIPILQADKLVHFAMYAFLTSAFCLDFFKSSRNKSYSHPWFLTICVAFPIVLGGAIELIQQKWFYPRTGEWLDWLADIVGVCLAALFWLALKKKGLFV